MSFFDTSVNEFLINQAKFSPIASPALGVVVESSCQYFASLEYPDVVEVGLFVSKLSNSSIKYECGVFKQHSLVCAAHGTFTHVYVDAATRKPVPVPPLVRSVVAEKLLLPLTANGGDAGNKGNVQ